MMGGDPGHGYASSAQGLGELDDVGARASGDGLPQLLHHHAHAWAAGAGRWT